MIVPGTLLAGRFEIKGELGRGGTAVVYLARDNQLDTQVALKVLHGHLTDDRIMRDRLRREVRTCRKLTHPHILPVYDLLEAEGHLFAVMAYHPGKTLVEYLSEKGPMPVEDVIRLGGQVASALEMAHLNGVVHRDIKPHNLLLDERGQVMLTDFGFARMRELATLTATGHGMGTPGYAAPEVMNGARWEPRSDLYGLGAVLYEALTGSPPFPLSNPMATLRAQSAGPPPPPSLRRPETPAWLDQLVMKLLQPSPEARPDGPGVVREILHHRRLETWQPAPSSEVIPAIQTPPVEVQKEVPTPPEPTPAVNPTLPGAEVSPPPTHADTRTQAASSVSSEPPPAGSGPTPPGGAADLPSESVDLVQMARTAAWGLHDFYTRRGLFVPPPVVDLVNWTQAEGASRLASDIGSGWQKLQDMDQEGRLRPRPGSPAPNPDSREVEWHYSVLVHGELEEDRGEHEGHSRRRRRRRRNYHQVGLRQEKAAKLHQILVANQLLNNHEVDRLEELMKGHRSFSVVDGLRREQAEQLAQQLNEAGVACDLELTNLSRFLLRPWELAIVVGGIVLVGPVLALLVAGVAPFLVLAFLLSIIFNEQMSRQLRYEAEDRRARQATPIEMDVRPPENSPPVNEPVPTRTTAAEVQPAPLTPQVAPAPADGVPPPVMEARVDSTAPIVSLAERNTTRTQQLRLRVLAQGNLPEVLQVDLLSRLLEVASVSQALGNTAVKLELTLSTLDEPRLMREVSTLEQRQKRQLAQGNAPDPALGEAILEQLRVLERLRQLEEEQTTCMARLMSLSAGLDAISLLLSEADRMDDVEEVRRFHEVMERLTSNLDSANAVTQAPREGAPSSRGVPTQILAEAKAR